MDARLHEAEDEVALLRGEVRQLRTEVSIEKNRRKICSCAYQRKKKSWRKHGIKRDVPSIPPGEEKKLLDKPAP
ncbi:hypothetical protein CK203_105108 [Vitis vinifera]|uniref:Uncharacterized protein n=1 Tax=Vitis vinifera TaxID=29760 RepID=A0A438CNQ7_VITVI|nr:hypothetical protein CK203_105108 [Vitis vinifera]